MAAATFNVRQFFNIPFITSSQSLTSFTAPTGVFVVTGSESRVLINDSRTNLANDSFSMNAELGGLSTTLPFSSSTSNGWWPGPPTIAYNPSPEEGYLSYGIIVGGVDGVYNNSTPPPIAISSSVSCWGFPEGGVTGTESQEELNTLFAELASSVLGVFQPTAEDAAVALRTAGFYYQFPVGKNGQSPNTGTGSDV
jgi:hypothetical protein